MWFVIFFLYFFYAFPKLSTINIIVQNLQVNFVDSIPGNPNGDFSSLEQLNLSII